MLRLWSLSWILHWLQATFSQAWSPCLYQKKLSSLWFLRNTKHEKILKTYLSFFVMFLIQIFVPINVKIMFFLIISSPYYCRSNKIRAYVNKKCILRLSKMIFKSIIKVAVLIFIKYCSLYLMLSKENQFQNDLIHFWSRKFTLKIEISRFWRLCSNPWRSLYRVIQWKSYEKNNSELETAWISMICWIPQDF